MSIAYDNLAERLAFGMPDRLDKALNVAGITALEMAEYMGVSRTTISNYTNGRSPVKKQTLRLWAMKTGVPLQWLEDGTLDQGDRGPEGTTPANQELRFSPVISHPSWASQNTLADQLAA